MFPNEEADNSARIQTSDLIKNDGKRIQTNYLPSAAILLAPIQDI